MSNQIPQFEESNKSPIATSTRLQN